MVDAPLSRNDLCAVSTTAVIVADRRPDSAPRKAIYIRNSSTAGQVITLSPSDAAPAVSSYGIVLKPGECWVDSTSEGYKCWQGSVNAISDAINGQVSVFEQ